MQRHEFVPPKNNRIVVTRACMLICLVFAALALLAVFTQLSKTPAADQNGVQIIAAEAVPLAGTPYAEVITPDEAPKAADPIRDMAKGEFSYAGAAALLLGFASVTAVVLGSDRLAHKRHDF